MIYLGKNPFFKSILQLRGDIMTKAGKETLDLSAFLNQIFLADTEVEMLEVIGQTPQIFQEKLWEIIQEMSSVPKRTDLRPEIRVASKKIILDIMKESSEKIKFFSKWLSGIPMIPIYIISPLQDNYLACEISYDNFSDQYNFFDEKAFYDNAVKKITQWVESV